MYHILRGILTASSRLCISAGNLPQYYVSQERNAPHFSQKGSGAFMANRHSMVYACIFLTRVGVFTLPRTKTNSCLLETHHALVLLGNSFLMGSTRKVRFFYLVL